MYISCGEQSERDLETQINRKEDGQGEKVVKMILEMRLTRKSNLVTVVNLP